MTSDCKKLFVDNIQPSSIKFEQRGDIIPYGLKMSVKIARIKFEN